jgi:predicted transposase YbfD/YdcC
MIHQHWSVENLNHRKRDATYWRENKAPKRNTLLTVIPFEEFDALNDAFDCYRDQREKSVKIITTASPHQE